MSLPPDLKKEDIGNGVWIHRVSGGLIVGHDLGNGDECCCGSILFDVPGMEHVKATGRKLWRVISEEPLTLSPSIHSPNKCLNGWITEGQWVNCDKGEYRATG